MIVLLCESSKITTVIPLIISYHIMSCSIISTPINHYSVCVLILIILSSPLLFHTANNTSPQKNIWPHFDACEPCTAQLWIYR